MATIRLVPSTIYNGASNYLTISNASNAYNNTDNTTYATITNTYSSTSSRYIYIRGFNFDAIDSSWTVNSFTVKIKAYESGISTSTNYVPYLSSGTSTLSGCTTTAITTSASVHTFTCNLDWETIKSYGSNFGIRVNCRRSSRNTTGYMYIYGAEILVNYTIPVYHSINVTGTDVSPSGSQSVLEGESLTVKAYHDTKPTVTDNGVDVSNQLVQGTESGATYEVENVGNYGFALNGSGYYESQNRGIDKSAAVCRVDFNVPVAATITFTYINYAEASYDFGVFGNIDVELSNSYYAAGSSGATITDSSYKLACKTSSHNTSSAQTLTYSMTAGEHSIWVKYSKDDASAANNDTLQFKVTITLDEPFTPRTYWGYTLTNITIDHTIIVTASGGGNPPVITVGTPTRTIISDETGYDQCVCTFTSDLALQQWEARATKAGVTPARGVGLLVESGTTLSAGATGTIIVDNEELTQGDGEYTITVYGQSTGGIWSQ